jgi:hypothetical protein
MTAPESASRKPRQLDAGSFQPEISSSCLHLAAEGKAAKTVGTYTEAVVRQRAPAEAGCRRRRQL